MTISNLDGITSSNIVMGGGTGGVTSLTTQCWIYTNNQSIEEEQLNINFENNIMTLTLHTATNSGSADHWKTLIKINDLIILTYQDEEISYSVEFIVNTIVSSDNPSILTYQMILDEDYDQTFPFQEEQTLCVSFFKNTIPTKLPQGKQLELPGLDITGGTSISGETTITGNMTISGETTKITGDTNITGVVGVSGDLDLTGAMTIKKTGTSYLQEFVFSISYEIFENAPKTTEYFKQQIKARYNTITGISTELLTVRGLSPGSTKVLISVATDTKPSPNKLQDNITKTKDYFNSVTEIIKELTERLKEDGTNLHIKNGDLTLKENVETYFQAEYLVEEPYFSITQGTKLNENLFAVDNCGNIIINNKGKISYKDKGYTDPSSNKTVGEITFFDNSNSTPEKARITNNYVNDASQTLLELMMEQPRRFAFRSNTPKTDKINLVWNLDHLYPKIFSTNANGSNNLATGFGVSSAFNVLPQITKINVEIQDASTSTNDPSWNPLFYIDQSHNINSKSLYDTSINIFDISSNENRSYYDDNIFYLDQICVNPTIDSTNSNILVNSSSSPSQDSSGVKILKTKFYNSKNKVPDVSFNIRIYGVNNSFLPTDCSNNALYYQNLAFLTFNEPSGVSIKHIGKHFSLSSSANSGVVFLKSNKISDISLNIKEIEKDSDESTFFINKVDISYSSFASCTAQQSFVDNSNSYNVTETSNSKFPDNRKDNSTNLFLDISSSLHPINLFWATKYNIAARVYNNSSIKAVSKKYTIKDISQIYTAIPASDKTNYTRRPSFQIIPHKNDFTSFKKLLVITKHNIPQTKSNQIYYANNPHRDNSSNIILHFTNLKYELTKFSEHNISYNIPNCKNIGNDVSKNKTLGTLRLTISNEHINLSKTKICDISFIVNDFSNNKFDVSYCKNDISGINSSDGGHVIRDIFRSDHLRAGIRLGADISSITIKNIKDSSNIYTVDLSYNTNLNPPPSGQDWSGNIDFIVDTHIEDPSLKSGVSGFSKTPKNYTKLLKQPHGHIFGISNEDISFNDISFTLKHINTKNQYLKKFNETNAEIGKIQIKLRPEFNPSHLSSNPSHLSSTIILPKKDISSNGEYDVSTNNTTLFDPSFLPTKRHVVTDTFNPNTGGVSSLTVILNISGTNLEKSKIVDTSSYTINLHSDETSLQTGKFPAVSSAGSGNIYLVDTDISTGTTLDKLKTHLFNCINNNSYTAHSKPVNQQSLRYQGGDYVYKTSSSEESNSLPLPSERWMVFDLKYLHSNHTHITNVINNLQGSMSSPWSNISKAYVFYFDNDGNIRIGDILSKDEDIVDAERWFMNDSNKTTNTLNDSVSIKTQGKMSDTADEKITNAGLSTGILDNAGLHTTRRAELFFLFGCTKT
jgi:hypothetical protein